MYEVAKCGTEWVVRGATESGWMRDLLWFTTQHDAENWVASQGRHVGYALAGEE